LASFIIICFRTSCMWSSSFDSAEPMGFRKHQSFYIRFRNINPTCVALTDLLIVVFTSTDILAAYFFQYLSRTEAYSFAHRKSPLPYFWQASLLIADKNWDATLNRPWFFPFTQFTCIPSSLRLCGAGVGNRILRHDMGVMHVLPNLPR
jgi:hypothetical protein